jgi:hypothetical protein
MQVEPVFHRLILGLVLIFMVQFVRPGREDINFPAQDFHGLKGLAAALYRLVVDLTIFPSIAVAMKDTVKINGYYHSGRLAWQGCIPYLEGMIPKMGKFETW